MASVCVEPGCPNLRPCGEHQRRPWEGSSRRSELPSDWNRRRRRVIRRDGGRCVWCGSSKQLEVDHIGDRHDHSYENLRTLCHDCHTGRTQKQAQEARRH